MTKTVLTEQKIIQIIKEEWNSKLSKILKELDASEEGTKSPNLISPGLKVKAKKSGLLYTVISVGKDEVEVKTPEGKEIIISAKDLEKNYELD